MHNICSQYENEETNLWLSAVNKVLEYKRVKKKGEAANGKRGDAIHIGPRLRPRA